jgi:ribosomal protein S27E
VVSSLLCDSMLVKIKCINVRRNTTVFSNCKKTTTCFGPFLGGPYQVETRISETTHILQCGRQEWGTRLVITWIHFLYVFLVAEY